MTERLRKAMDRLEMFGAFVMCAVDGLLLMLLVGVLNDAYGWPGFTLHYWHATFIVFVFYPVFQPVRRTYTRDHTDSTMWLFDQTWARNMLKPKHKDDDLPPGVMRVE